MIWDLAYDNGRTTGLSSGAYNLPDGLYVLHDTGCKLSYGSTATTSTKEYQSELSASASVEGGFDAAFVSGEFSASMDYQRNAESQEESSMTTIISKAECMIPAAERFALARGSLR